MTQRLVVEYGEKLGMLTYLCDLPCISPNYRRCLFLCECGTLKATSLSSWRTGATKSCGCLLNKVRKTANSTHGMYKTKIYNSWLGMKDRCRNMRFTRYAQRGITVCDKWQTFEGFYEDMGDTWEAGLSVDRIDNSKGYCKENCKWSNPSDQGYNKDRLSRNKSGKTGVAKIGNKWKAYISKACKNISLGFFENFEEAVAAREKAEIEYYGFNKE